LRNKLKKILLFFGVENQILKCIEELSELIKELAKNNNRNAIIEEIADCEIMLEQMKLAYYIDTQEIEDWKKEKINRVIMKISKG